MGLDFQNAKLRYSRKKEAVLQNPNLKTREILRKYIEFHDKKIERNQIETSSALRSLDVADSICEWEKIFSESPYSVEAVKCWWKYQLERSSSVSNKPISIGTLKKFESQTGKFLKFLEFLATGEDVAFFNTKRLPPAKASRYFIIEVSRKKKEIQRLNLDKFILLLHELIKSPFYYERVAGVLLISAYDLGCRFGELASLKNKSFQVVDGQLIVTLEESKTITRTVVPILSKKYLINWQSMSPSKDNPDGFFFCSRNGGIISYDKVSVALRKVSDRIEFSFPEGKLWHYLRHEFASRAYQMPENLIRYYLGWNNGGIREIYSHYNWKDCLPYLYKMNETNPLLEEPLSILEKEDEIHFERQLEKMVEEKVKVYLKNKRIGIEV